jgi:hypothetical protein
MVHHVPDYGCRLPRCVQPGRVGPCPEGSEQLRRRAAGTGAVVVAR